MYITKPPTQFKSCSNQNHAGVFFRLLFFQAPIHLDLHYFQSFQRQQPVLHFLATVALLKLSTIPVIPVIPLEIAESSNFFLGKQIVTYQRMLDPELRAGNDVPLNEISFE